VRITARVIPIIQYGDQAMNKDQVKGAAKEAAGKLQKKAGRMTGNASQELKGTAREVSGKAQKAYGNAKSDREERRAR
jgi:uncharacterized protein YjbJ (UPF0337 family)